MKIAIWLLSLIELTLLSTAASAATYYVAVAGDDTSIGTKDHPWRTLGYSLPQLIPGDTLIVRGGVYRECLNHIAIRPGTAKAPITVEASLSERPVLQGLLWLSEPSYWTVDGLNVTWDSAVGGPRDHMVKFTNGVGWTFKRAEVYGACSFAAILVAGTRPHEPSDWKIADNVIHDTRSTNGANQDHLIYVNSGTDSGPGLIEHNLLYGAPNGEGVKLGGPKTIGGSANVTIRSNTILNAAQDILIAGASHDNVVDHNILGSPSGNYGCIRGYRLAGQRNTACGNRYVDAARLIMNDLGYAGVEDAGGNSKIEDSRLLERLRNIKVVGSRSNNVPIGVDGATSEPVSRN